MKGHPKYKLGQTVNFECDGLRKGIIYIIDKYGAIGCDDVSYDILCKSENTLYKHVLEKFIYE